MKNIQISAKKRRRRKQWNIAKKTMHDDEQHTILNYKQIEQRTMNCSMHVLMCSYKYISVSAELDTSHTPCNIFFLLFLVYLYVVVWYVHNFFALLVLLLSILSTRELNGAKKAQSDSGWSVNLFATRRDVHFFQSSYSLIAILLFVCIIVSHDYNI